MELIPINDTSKTPAQRFTGDVFLTVIKTPTPPSRLIASLVRFTPGARTNWHSHALGQTLHVTEGVGYIVNRAGQTIVVRAGDTVWTPPGGAIVKTCGSRSFKLLQADLPQRVVRRVCR
jgi:quercetin dioxygenase-like cupin family protein